MARQVKDKWLAARADDELFTEVGEYIEAANTTMGELIRKAVKEYLWAHPKPLKKLSKEK